MTFHSPIILTPKAHPKLCESSTSADAVRALTAQMHEKLRSGLVDAPSWEIIQAASLAARLCFTPPSNSSLHSRTYNVKEYVKMWKNLSCLFSEASRATSPDVPWSVPDIEKVRSLFDEIKVCFCNSFTRLAAPRPLITAVVFRHFAPISQTSGFSVRLILQTTNYLISYPPRSHQSSYSRSPFLSSSHPQPSQPS